MKVVLRVMAAGVNDNNVWAALGQPVSVFRYHEEDHHIGGSDASGVVWKVGDGVTRWKVGDGVKRWKPGDEVVIHCNQASYEDPEVHTLDPMAAPSQRIWGYETTWGSLARFCKAQAHGSRLRDRVSPPRGRVDRGLCRRRGQRSLHEPQVALCHQLART